MSGERDRAQAIGQLADDFERIGADRSGGAKNRDPAHKRATHGEKLTP